MTLLLRVLPHLHIEQPSLARTLPPTHEVCMHCTLNSTQWYTATMNLLGTWLTERMDQQLHVYQLKILIRITKMYDTVRNRLTVEEATASVREGGMQGISMKDSDEEDEEDD
ncbi:hypothetical protein INR49_029672 [Caranx melampygus]|nr:hypothetical protein INR49_029672 [Caranx melampygus]